MKKLFAWFLTLALMISVSAVGLAAPVKATQESVASQINLIYSNFAETFKQVADGEVWSYTVTDLDHNGRLELLAASIQGSGRFTHVKAWEVGEDLKSFISCNVNVKEGDSFPDIISNTADTYYVAATDTWNYMFDDSITSSSTEVMAARCSVSMKSSNIGYIPYAYQQTEFRDNLNIITFTDKSGRLLTPEDYNASVTNAFAGAQKSSTNFDWFLESEATSSSRFSDSYAIFIGDVVPVGAAAASNAQTTTVAPAAPAVTPLPSQQNSYLIVTKNPTNENHKPGETALFVANANNWASVTWTFVAPAGGEYSWQSFGNMFPKSIVYGVNETTLTIKNVTAEMNGWSAYATFYSKNGQTARTNSAFLYVTDKNAKTTTVSNSSISGVVTDPLMSTVTIYLSNGSSVQVPRGICSVIYGDLVAGCSCTAYYSGKSATSSSIYHVDIYGSLTTYTTSYYEYYCPYCHGQVGADDVVCRHCGYVFATGAFIDDSNGGVADDMMGCPVCHNSISIYTSVCPYCGFDIDAAIVSSLEDQYGGYAGIHYEENESQNDSYDGGNYSENENGGYAGINYYENEYNAYSDYSSGGVQDNVKPCPNCYSSIPDTATSCPYCGYDLYGGYAGSNYYENEYGGYAGSNYYENEYSYNSYDSSDYSYSDYSYDSYDY